MSYRVTNSMMQNLMLNDMHNNLSKLIDIQQQLSTQRKYQTASQNPNAVTKGMGLETMLVEGEQYISNLQDAVSWLKFTESALGNMTDTFQRIRELALYAGDGSLEGVDLGAIAEELRQLKEEMRSYANATIGTEYLFSGLKTSDLPFTLGPNGDVVYNGNDYSLFWEFARQQTGQVSLTGNDIFPASETTNRLKGIEVPIDFEWTGRGEILEFKVGWQTVKVRIPERWEDEIRNGITDTSDYNRYRDPGEKLDGYTLDEIAALINKSTEMGDVSKLLKATVVKDLDKGVQYLQIQSHTGEPVRLTSWPETDPVDLAEGIKGAAYGAVAPPRAASGDGRISLRFGDNTVYTVDVEKGEDLKAVVTKLNNLPDGRIWAAYKTDGTNEWIDIVGRNPGDYFTMETTGGATMLFAPEMVTTQSKKSGTDQIVTSNVFAPTGGAYAFESLSDGVLSIRQGNKVYEIAVPAGSDLDAVKDAIDNAAAPFTAEIDADGALVVKADPANDAPFAVTASGGLVPLYSDGVTMVSNAKANSDGKYIVETAMIPLDFELQDGSAIAFEYDGARHWVDISGCTDLESVKDALNAALQAIDPTAVVSIKSDMDEEANVRQWLVFETEGGPFRLSGYGGAADVISKHVLGSEAIDMNADHTHIGFAAMMGMETSIKSTELPMDSLLGDTTQDGQMLHLKFVSGNNKGEVLINDDADLTLEELAQRINNVCGDWLQAVVETDVPDGTNPLVDPLNNSGDNREDATQRLVLRTIDGAPFAVYDGPGKLGSTSANYAQTLGIGTALMGEVPGPVVYPDSGDGIFDSNMPAILEVQVGDRKFEVKVCRNNCGTAEKVVAAIARQVNEQYGGTLLAWDANDIAGAENTGTFALYAVTGEPLRVVDKGFGDPRYSEYTGGIAMQLGIAPGVTSSAAMQYDTQMGAGVIRISTPGRTVEVPVLAGENLHQIANRIRDYAGTWLDVSFVSDNIGADNANVSLSISAKDGSAVTMFDVSGSVSQDLGMDTGLVGTANLLTDWPTIGQDDTLTITVNGASHTIDLYDDTAVPPTPIVATPEELADLINTRFQGQDIRAEVLVTRDAAGNITNKRVALWSPKGYTFEVSGTSTAGGDTIPDDFGFVPGVNAESKSHGGTGPFNQVTTTRTGNNQTDITFFGVLDNLINTVEGGNVDGISDVMLGQLDDWMTNLLKCRAQVGALTSRYTTAQYRLTSNNTDYTDLHTQTVGVDLAQVITNYEMSAGIYEASLAAIARIMQPTLLDFLR